MADRLEVQFPGGKRVDVKVGGFVIPTDQSARDGGDESAPTPFCLFLASLAACAGYYALSFCQGRNLSTEGLGLTLDWESEKKRQGPARAVLRLSLPEGFPVRYRHGILKAVGACAVKKQLEQPPEWHLEVDG